METSSRELFADADPVLDPEVSGHARSVVEWVVVVAGAILVAILIKTFVVQAFFIPSESMVPTLQVGDRVLVNKLSYHLHPINRGDIVVFSTPPGEPADVSDLIKRVVALPGETVVINDNHVYVDGHQLEEPYLPAGTQTVAKGTWTHRCTPDDPCPVPSGDIWVMGDNRGNSEDSRYFGPISEDLVVGRAFVIVWPLNRAAGL